MNKSSIHFICVITLCLSLVIIIFVALVAHMFPALEKGIATHSSILAWRISWPEEPGGCNPVGHKELDMTEGI